MVIEREAFETTETDEVRAAETWKVLSVKLNAEEIATLEEDARLLHQEKASTALKQLAIIGSKVIRLPLVAALIGIPLNNIRKNRRIGIEFVEPKLKRFQQK